jgi:hypothetical protein
MPTEHARASADLPRQKAPATALQQPCAQHGADAAIHAAGRADLLLEEGDIDGAAIWRAIVKAIEELQRERRPGKDVR